MTEREKLIIFNKTRAEFKCAEKDTNQHTKEYTLAGAYALVQMMTALDIFEEFKVWNQEQDIVEKCQQLTKNINVAKEQGNTAFVEYLESERKGLIRKLNKLKNQK